MALLLSQVSPTALCKMVEVNCYNCRSTQHRFYARENGFTLVQCVTCGLLYVTPRPDDREIDRAREYGEHRGDELLATTGAYSPWKVKAYKRILRDLYASHPRGTWLDVGCGFGEFLMALRSDDLRVSGVEPNRHKRASALARGLDVGEFDIATSDRKFDFVSLLNVYSHLQDPPRFLAACRNLLKPGGELLLETGDVSQLSPETMYRPLFLPDHLSFATEGIARKLMEEAGFEIIAVHKYPAYALTFTNAAVELIKLCWPGKRSGFRYLMRRDKTDMYVRARLKLD